MHLYTILRLFTDSPLGFTSQIMMLVINVALSRASRHRLKVTTNRDHEWSNSVGKKFFIRLTEAVTPHYGLWVYVVQYP